MGKFAQAQHDLLLIIVTGLFILFATGLTVPLANPVTPVILSSG